MLDKFYREFSTKLLSTINDLSPQNYTDTIPEFIDSYEFTQLLVEMGCAQVVDM